MDNNDRKLYRVRYTLLDTNSGKAEKFDELWRSPHPVSPQDVCENWKSIVETVNYHLMLKVLDVSTSEVDAQNRPVIVEVQNVDR